MSKLIVVNNPAAKEGGVLTILKEFLEKTSSLTCNRQFLVLVSLEELKKYENTNLKIKVILKQSFKDRIIWDNFRIKKYLEDKKITPDIFISLQNTGVNIDSKIPQIIYYQQSLSLSDLKWNIFNKDQRLYWMYKNIYPFFIKQHLNKMKKVVVQTEWVKDGFSKKFNYPKENIVLIRPKIKKKDIYSIKMIPKEKFRIFYPATPFLYKNHKVVIEALGLLKKENPGSLEKVECIFTFSKGEKLELDSLIKKLELEDIVKLIGKISYEQVLEYYKSSDLLVFPSYLETFGLPLAEAQQFNLEILAADLPYSREVVGDYSKCKFLKFDCYNAWKEIMKNQIK
ncbi:MAG: glycosyltransferase [Fusobacteriaceae bacterium]